MNRLRLGALVLATAAVLFLPSISHAQRWRGGGWGGRGWDGGRWDGGAWEGGRSGFYFGYGSPYGFSLGYGRGYYSPSWSGNTYGYSYPYSYDYSYSYPSTYGYAYSSSPSYYASQQPGYYSYGTPGYSYESAYPSQASSNMMMGPEGSRVMARVLVPDANAKLWIEGQQMNSTGLEREFVSPPIQPGYGYSYTFRAQWSENGQQKDETRVVQVQPGDAITADFTHTAPRASEMRGGARQSGYGPDEGKPRRIDENATPQRDTPVVPSDRPNDRNDKPRSDTDRLDRNSTTPNQPNSNSNQATPDKSNSGQSKPPQ